MPTHLASVLLVNAGGRVLLQERDEHAPRGAGQWGMPGGHVEPGETFEEAAYREITEQTGLRLLPGHLYLWRDETLSLSDDTVLRIHVYAARVDDTTDADIVCGEGRQMVFVEPDRIRALDLVDTAEALLLPFLDSEDFARLAGFESGGGHEGERSLTGGDAPEPGPSPG